MPATTRDVEFTAPASGLALPIADYTLPAGLYRGSITRLYPDSNPMQVTVLLSPATLFAMDAEMVGRWPFAGTQGQRIDITADYNSGAIREDQGR